MLRWETRLSARTGLVAPQAHPPRRSRFLQCGGRRDHKGLTHIFNPPPKSKWPVWCLLHPPPPSPCPFLCLTRMSPALLFPGLCFGAAAVWGNALSSSSVPHAQSSGRPGIPAPRLGGARSWESDLPQQNLGDSVRPLGPLVPSFPTGFRWKELCKSWFLVSIQRQFHAVRSSLCCARGRTDTDLIDISVGGKGGGGVRGSIWKNYSTWLAQSLCLSLLAWQEGLPITMSHKGCFL